MIREATLTDVPLIAQLIHELAVYEKLEHEVSLNEADLREHLFGKRRFAEVILAENDSSTTVGFALFFHNYSTFLGRPGIYLEDLFVRPEHRGKGLGKALLKHVATLAIARGCGRLEWSVLDWNAPSIAFYTKCGASPMDDWTIYRLAGETLHTFARN